MASSITHNPYSIKKLLGLASYASVNMRVRPHYLWLHIFLGRLESGQPCLIALDA